MITRARAVLTGLTALTLLALVVVGLPVLLYRFGGSPVPGHLGSWHHLAAALSSRDNGSLLLILIRDCSWLAWLLFTLCVLAEAQAAIRGRHAPRLRLGGLQGAASQLVALAALAFATPSAITLSAAVTSVSHAPAGAPQAYLGAPAAQTASLDSAAAPASRMIIVRPGDCLWSIARHYLGAGDRYPEIVRLNFGHDMGDGQIFRNPALIEPGWQLFLPDHAAADPAVAPASHHSGHPTADRHYRRRHPAAIQGNNSSAGNAQATPSASLPARASSPAGPDPSADFQTLASANPAGDPLPEAVVFVTGALAGALLTSLTRLRHRQWQVRRRGRRIALPADPDVLAAEQRLRAAAPAEPLETLRDALACLEAGLLATGQEQPDIVGLHVTAEVLEVLLAAPAVDGPPAPFAISPGRQGMCWQLDLPAVVTVPGAPGRELAGLACHLLPGLMTAGATDGGYLLLDLESLQVTSCDGPPELIDRVVTTLATELATGQWSGWYDLILVGYDELEVLGRAEHCATLDQALALIEARCARVGPRIAERAPAEVRELRLAEPDNEDWGLTILVSRIEPEPGQLTRLLALAEDGPGGIAALIAGDPEAADGRMAPTALQLAPDTTGGIVANVVPLQISVRPRTLSAADYDSIATLLAAAADLTDVGQDEVPYAMYAAPPWIPQAAELDPLVPEAPAEHLASAFLTPSEPEPDLDQQQAALPLEVRILGPFLISGAAGPLQPKQAELVLALALAAPAGLSNSALCAILGADPDHPKPTDAVRQIITRTRRRLGLAADGQEHIIHAGNGQYLLHPDVTLDWSKFRALMAAGRADDLRQAMSLITGQPFTGSYFWWIDIPLIETVRAELVDAAETLAEFELATGSARAAAKAARAGLLAESSAEQLWRLIMRAEHAAGNLAGVAEAWRRCLDAIEDVAPGGEPHPETEALYRQLTMTGVSVSR